MCRLLAWHSQTPLTVEQVVAPDSHRLAELSQVHCDGWGFAKLNAQGELRTAMGSQPAHESPEFLRMTSNEATSNGIVHLRWATGDLAVSPGNTHPFTAKGSVGDIAFVHNGYLPEPEDLLDDINPQLVAAFRGETDSERYFGLFATELEHEGGDVVSALRRTAKRLSHKEYTSLNAMILTPSTIAVLCLFKPENRPLDEDEDYFDLTWGDQQGVVSAWSTGVRPSFNDGRPLDNGTVLLVDTSSGATSIESIA